MKRKNQDIESALVELALLVVNQALVDDVEFGMRLDALKIGTQFLVGSYRAKSKTQDDEEQAPLFDRARAVLKTVDGGKKD